MQIEHFAWVRQPEIIDADHPDFAALIELDDVEQWIADGAPSPVEPPPPMPAAPRTVEVPAVAFTVSRADAAALLSISVDTFERHVLPDLRVVQVGRRQLVPVGELAAWIEAKSARALR